MNANKQPQVAEIVSFRLKNGTDRATFLTDARATAPLLQRTDGFIRRALSEGDDGTWTDIVYWSSMEAAKSAAEHVVRHPDFAPFGAAIDGPSVAMRHERVAVNME